MSSLELFITSQNHLDKVLEEAKNGEVLDIVSLKLNAEQFQQVEGFLDSNPGLGTLRASRENLSLDQAQRLTVLVNQNSLKGLKFQDEEGNAFGSAYTDWGKYNAAKMHVSQQRETTTQALTIMKTPPQTIIVFGSGTGGEVLTLLDSGAKKIIAIDGDHEAMNIFRQRIPEEHEQRVECFEGPFITFNRDIPADLFICSFTWPYRPKKDFGPCWEKTVSLVAEGGLIAGHFFGAPEEPDPAMSYHTEDEVKALILQRFDILYFKSTNGSDMTLYGGSTPPCGALYHVVARKRSRSSRCIIS